jgi:hypothetical protein
VAKICGIDNSEIEHLLPAFTMPGDLEFKPPKDSFSRMENDFDPTNDFMQNNNNDLLDASPMQDQNGFQEMQNL